MSNDTPRGFSITISDWVKQTGVDIDQAVRKIEIDLFSRIILKSPVDTGRFRNNWTCTTAAPSTEVKDAKVAAGQFDRSGNLAIKEMTENVGGAGHITFFCNNLPYAWVLEYGGYPIKPKRGSRVKGRGYQIKSAGGYSYQAPHGMVGISMLEIQPLILKFGSNR